MYATRLFWCAGGLTWLHRCSVTDHPRETWPGGAGYRGRWELCTRPTSVYGRNHQQPWENVFVLHFMMFLISLNNKNSCTEGLRKVSKLKSNLCAAVCSPTNRRLSRFVDYRLCFLLFTNFHSYNNIKILLHKFKTLLTLQKLLRSWRFALYNIIWIHISLPLLLKN